MYMATQLVAGLVVLIFFLNLIGREIVKEVLDLWKIIYTSFLVYKDLINADE